MVNLEKSNCSRTSYSSAWWWTLFALLVLASVATRFYSLHEPDHVCWDETHFGKFAGFYINRTYFFDVHPPLGKVYKNQQQSHQKVTWRKKRPIIFAIITQMLIGLFGYLDGYKGNFAFDKPGDKYNDYPYIGMRVGCAIMGALLVPLCFLTVWEMTFSLTASTLASSMILFDHGVLTLSRFILLDPAMLLFISLSFYCSVKFQNQRHQSFSLAWWCWLSTVGVMLSAAISVKFVGLFIVLLVGLQTAADLWIILGDISQPVTYTLKHFMARVLCLILLPSLLYVGTFYIHLSVLNRSGPGDGFVSLGFQISLDGNELNEEFSSEVVEYGAELSLKNSIIGGGYLHSHQHLYPEEFGPQQQQITSYNDKKDPNSIFIVKRTNQIQNERHFDDQLVRNGDFLWLQHNLTQRALHSHNYRAPLALNQFQVTGYGNGADNDPNDVWQLVIENAAENEILKAVNHRFQLVHHVQDCVLSTTTNKLPDWGYEQQEVTCNPNKRDISSYWNIQFNFNPRLPKVSFRHFGHNFIQRFVESHQVMLQGNSGLKPKPREQTSRPWMWPLNTQGQFFSYHGDKSVYLLGNPIIWWANLAFITIFLLSTLIFSVLAKRLVVLTPHQIVLQERAMNASRWLFIGWLFHYVPFWTMTRILYFHHYFPAFLFSCMLSGIILDYLIELIIMMLPAFVSNRTRDILLLSIACTLIYSFYLFAPLSYGFTMNLPIKSTEAEREHFASNKSSMSDLRWMSTWDF